MTRTLRPTLVLLLLAFPFLCFSLTTPAAATTTAVAVSPSEDFPVPEGLTAAVEFWTKVYSAYSTRQVVMHDNRYLGIVYGTLDFTAQAKGRSEGALNDLIDDASSAERERIIGLLMELDSFKEGIPFSKLSPEQRRIHEMFSGVEELDRFRAAAERVRGQRGQKDKFMEGIANVAPYMARMEQAFRKRGLPSDLSRLTFVESMFNLHAYSKVGAAGPWQFMSGTGKRFLTISPEVDERMDPILSTEAAARLLQENRKNLPNWGLALTAYNHGVAGMRRAVNDVGSEEIGQIVWAYESRSFGFASRNFYAEFLAARDVYNQREKYFGAALAALPPRTAPVFEEVLLPDHVAIGTLVKYGGVAQAEIESLNPQLTRYVLSGQKYLPKQYPLKVPAGRAAPIVAAYAKIPRTLRYAAQKPNEYHVVRRGDTLVAIARKYAMSVDAVMDLNALSSRNRLRAGQKLRVLAADKGTLVAKADVKAPAVKVVPAVKLAGDLAPPVVEVPVEDTKLPIPELPEEELRALAAAEAPAMELADTLSPPVSPLPGPGSRSLQASASAPLVVVAPAPATSGAAPPMMAAAAPSFRFIAMPAVSAVESLVIATIPSGADPVLPRPESGPRDGLREEGPAEDDADWIRHGGRPPRHPGGVRCRAGRPSTVLASH